MFNLSSFAEDGWFRQNIGLATTFFTVFFTTPDTGWAGGIEAGTGDGVLIRTANGGNTWVVQYFANNSSIRSIYFTNSKTGYAVGDQNSGVGLILKTTNKGQTWEQQNSNSAYLLSSVYFRNNTDTGWAVGNSGTILKTTNGGNNWLIKNSGTLQGLFCISHPYPNRGWVGKSGNTILYSINGGDNWTQQSVGIIDGWGSASFICCNGVGWFMGGEQASSPIIKTTNYGLNWIVQDLPLLVKFSMYFYDENTGWVVGTSIYNRAAIYNTTNGGTDWNSQISAYYTNNLKSIYFVNNYTGWAVGYGGIILKTTNGGIPTGINKITSVTPKGFLLYQNYPNPFNPKTLIKFQISKFTYVSLKVYDVLGRELTILINEQLKPGTYEAEFDGSNYPSGVYYYKLQTAEYTETKRMVLIK